MTSIKEFDKKVHTLWIEDMYFFSFESNTSWFERIKQHYNEPHRAYHNMNHIFSCLKLVEPLSIDKHDRHLLRLAIWFHDVIYNSYKKDNEEKSALMAQEFLLVNKLSRDQIKIVYQLILATLHNAPPKTHLEAFIMDIDIAILGVDKDKYKVYQTSVRSEYKWVPSFLYRKKRKEIMERFIAKPRIYETEHFFNLLEKQARINISSEIESL